MAGVKFANSPTVQMTDQTYASIESIVRMPFGQTNIQNITLIMTGFIATRISIITWTLRAAVAVLGGGVCPRTGAFWMRICTIAGMKAKWHAMREELTYDLCPGRMKGGVGSLVFSPLSLQLYVMYVLIRAMKQNNSYANRIRLNDKRVRGDNETSL